MNELLKNKVFLAFLGLVGLVIVCVIINNLTKTTTEDGEEIGALSALWRRLTKKDVVKKDDTDVVDDVLIQSQIIDGKSGCESPLKSAVSIEDGNEGPSRIITNSIPNHPMDGTFSTEDCGRDNPCIYATCPSEQSDDFKLPLDSLTMQNDNTTTFTIKTCDDGEYFDFRNTEGEGRKCIDISENPHRAQFQALGVVGRPTGDGHWSSTNKPQEIIDYDPTPAECWDVAAHDCVGEYDNKDPKAEKYSEYRYNIYGANQWDNTKGQLKYEDGTDMDVDVDAYNAHVQPDGAYHYHPPLVWDMNGDYADKVIGYLYDGIPIMGTGSKVLTDDGEVEATSSYIINEDWSDIKESGYACPSSDDIPKTPGGDGEQALFHSCYKFEEGAGNLDRYNGGISPALDDKYAYFATGKQYPYLPIFIKGK